MSFLFQSAGIATDFTTHNIVEQRYDAAGNPYMDLGFKDRNRGVTEDISGAAQNHELHVYFTLFANSFWRTSGFVEIHSANHYFEIYPSYNNNNRQVDFRFDGKAVKEDVNIAAPGDWNSFEIRIQTGKTDGYVTVIDNGKTIFEYTGNVLDGEPYTVVGLYDSRADFHNYVKNVAIWDGEKTPEWQAELSADISRSTKVNGSAIHFTTDYDPTKFDVNHSISSSADNGIDLGFKKQGKASCILINERRG